MVERPLTPARAPTGAARGRRRRVALAALAALVLLTHAGLADLLAEQTGPGAAADMPARIDVSYVRELALAAPPPAAAAAPAAPALLRPRAPPQAAKPASAPPPRDLPDSAVSAPIRPEGDQPGAQTEGMPAPPPEAAATDEPTTPVAAGVAPEQAAGPVATASGPAASEASAAAAAVSAPAVSGGAEAAVSAPAAASTAQAFEWPGSTRLSYVLTGNYRGEVHGNAQVEWVRAGSRYQVHLDVTVGLAMAPLMTRRATSDGELTAAGLVPHRYDEDIKVLFRDPRRATLRFEGDTVVLPDGQRRPRWPGVQDSASQFVQLSYLVSTQPGLLRVGNAIEIPLALPRRVDRWIYDVVSEELLDTPFGQVPSFHLRPRRLQNPGNELSAEVWLAPQLRYLPLRIRIRQDSETHIDLMIARRPELAAP